MNDQRQPQPIRIVIVDDHPMLREGVAVTMSRQPDFDVVGQGASAEEAISLAEDLMPDVMLLDINMPGGGLEALRTISLKNPAIAVIVVTVRDDEQTVSLALRIGARGYVLKGISGGELVRTVRSIVAGEHYVTPTLAARLLAEDSTTGGREPRIGELSVREMQILRLLAQGMSNKQIAGELSLSEKTIKHYMTNVMQKLQVRNRVEAALIAMQRVGTADKRG